MGVFQVSSWQWHSQRGMPGAVDAAAAPRITPAPRPRAENAASGPETVTDAVSLSPPSPVKPSRPIFEEAARHGLLAAGASIGGPLGKTLSTAAQEDLLHLLTDFDGAGFKFENTREPDSTQHTGWTLTPDRVQKRILESNGDWAAGHRTSPSCTYYSGDELVVSGPGIRRARVTGLHDLQALEALVLRHDARGLERADLADTLLALEREGISFTLQDREKAPTPRSVGAYGAYRALTLGPQMVPEESSWLRAGRPDVLPLPVRKTEDLDPLRYFVLGEDAARFTADSRASFLRDLEQRGATFHRKGSREAERLSAAEVFDELVRYPQAALAVGVRGASLEDLNVGAPISKELQALSDYNVEHMAPRVGDGRLSPSEADRWVQAVAVPIGALSPHARGAVLDGLHAMEQSLGTPREQCVAVAARELAALGEGLRPGEDAAAAAAELEALRREIGGSEIAVDTFRHIRLDLPERTFDPQDYAEQRARVVACARLAGLGDGGSFEQARQARELIEISAPFDEGARLLERLARLHQTIDGAGSALGRAMDDYKLLLRCRLGDEPADETCDTLQLLYESLLPHESLAACRDAFQYVQHGMRRKAFPHDSKSAVVDRLLAAWVMSRRLDDAREAVRKPDATQGGAITSDGDTVIVGGIRVPKRQHP